MNKKTKRIAGWALGLSMAVAGIGAAVGASYAVNGNEPMMVKAATGDELASCQGTGSGYGTRRTLTDSHNVGWVLSTGQSGYLGANNADNHNKVKPTANDLPVVKAVNANVTTSTTGYYFYYTTTAVSNVGSISFSYTANSGDTKATAYVVYSSVAASSGSATWSQVTLSAGSPKDQGDDLGSSGTFTYEFSQTETDSKYYGLVIVTSSYKRMTGGTIKLLEGSTSSQSVTADYAGETTLTYDGSDAQQVSLSANPDGFTDADGDLLYEWSTDNSSVLEITTGDEQTGTFTVKGAGQAKVRVYVTDAGSEEAYSAFVTFTVNNPADEALFSISIVQGSGTVTSYYDDDTAVDTTGLTLTAVYKSSTYASYSRTVTDIAADASGVEWTLDIENEKVKAAYTVKTVTKEAEFAITVSEAPANVVFNASEHTGVGDGVTETVAPITFTFSKGTNNSSSPTYNSSKGDTRVYKNNTLTIAGDATVQTIDKIVITLGYTGDDKGDDIASIAVNAGGSYTQNGWTLIFSETTEITITGGANQLRFSSMKVFYTEVPPADKDVESVTLDKTAATIEVGQNVTLLPTVTPADARDLSLKWTTSSPSVATVADGTVTGIATGVATITATSVDQPSISASATITVTAAPIISFVTTEALKAGQAKVGDTHLTISANSTAAKDTSNGSKWGSNSNAAGEVSISLSDVAVQRKNLKIAVTAMYSGNGSGTTAEAFVGTTSLGSMDLTKGTPTEMVFNYTGEESELIVPTDLPRIVLNNDDGAVYFKELKIYSAGSYSNIGNLVARLHLDDYNETVVEGEPVYENWCSDQEHNYYGKDTDNGAKAAFNALDSVQKTIFMTDAAYSAAYDRLVAWAAANGESINDSTKVLGANNANPYNFGSTIATMDFAAGAIAIVAIAGVGLASVAGFAFLRRKKEDR